VHGKRDIIAILFSFSMEKTRLRPLERLGNGLGKTSQAWEHGCMVLFVSDVLMDDSESRASLPIRPSLR